MASTPVITSPADYSSQTLPFSISGTSDGALVEVRDDAGLLLPADVNPGPVVAGSFTVSVQSLTGTRGCAVATAGGMIEEAAGGGETDDFSTNTIANYTAEGDAGGTWVVSTGKMRHTPPAGAAEWSTRFLRRNASAVADAPVLVKVSSAAYVQTTPIVDVRYGGGSLLRLVIGPTSMALYENPGTGFTMIGSPYTHSVSNEELSIEIDLSGTSVVVKRNTVSVITATTAVTQAGSVRFGAQVTDAGGQSENYPAAFDDFTFTPA